MLVLTRSIGERLMINGGEIKLSVLDVKGNQVRIGIEAPKEVSIHREEVFNRIHAQQAEASLDATSNASTAEDATVAATDTENA